MNAKEQKVKEVNEAIARSSWATKEGAKAELLPDGSIQYSKNAHSATGTYKAKCSFIDVLGMLQGEDMRELHHKYGKPMAFERRQGTPRITPKMPRLR